MPGLLAFREGPVVLAALERLTDRPDVLMFDAQGLAHPADFFILSAKTCVNLRPITCRFEAKFR